VVEVNTNDGGGVGVYLISKHDLLTTLCLNKGYDEKNLPEK